MKICILGAGALGCAIGGVLAEGGHAVWLVNRRQAHVDALNRHGLIMRQDGVDRVVAVRAATHCSGVSLVDGPIELLIVLVKSFDTREAIESAAPMLDARTMVLSLQNGLGHEDVLAEVVGRQRVLAGKTYAGGVMLGAGHILAGTRGKETFIGELDGSVSARVQAVADTLRGAGLSTEVSENIIATMWDKLLVNVATGALSAISGLPYGALYRVPEIEECALAAVAEAMAVAYAGGIALGTTDPRQSWVKAAAGLPPEFKASMLQSLEKGSITEVDYVNGAVVSWGARFGVATPVNRALVACVKGVERSLLMKKV